MNVPTCAHFSQNFRPFTFYPISGTATQKDLRNSGRDSAVASYCGGGNFYGPFNNKTQPVGTCTTFGVAQRIRSHNEFTKTFSDATAATSFNSTTKSAASSSMKTGCPSPDGCRCVNLDDPQKIFKLVLQAIRHISDGEGATPVEINCYMRKHHRLPDDEEKVMQIIKDSLKRGICMGCLRRRYCDGKYYISQKSSGRCKRKPPVCITKDPLPCKRACKKAGPVRKRRKCPPKQTTKPATKPKKKCPKPKPRKPTCKKPKSKKKCPKKPKPKCAPKKIKKKLKTKPKRGKPKSGKPKGKSKSGKPTSGDANLKKNKCDILPNVHNPFATRHIHKLDQIWENVPSAAW